MRVAIVADIHGNRTAFQAVLNDLKEMAPDLILHGGDLADGGSSPVEIIDQIRDLGWQGVVGNTDEMLWKPETLIALGRQSPQYAQLFAAIHDMALATCETLGPERLEWMQKLPTRQVHSNFALVHARPDGLWKAPSLDAPDAELSSIFTPLKRPTIVYAHIHKPYVRKLNGLTIANTGSVGLSYDGDRRASYLLLDDGEPTIRRVEYDLQKELEALHSSGRPHTQWIARILESGTLQMP